jgi:flagellar assembly protein FliH
MSATEKRSVLRKDGTRSVENFDLPKWDREGNLIRKPTRKPKPTQVEDVKQESVKVPTVKDVEAIREAAYNEGFEQGYENGLNQGKREGLEQGKSEGKEAGHKEGLIAGEETGRAQAFAEEQKKTEEKLAVFESLSDSLKNQVSHEQSELEQALLTLAVRLARQVVQDELRLKPSHIESVVHAAVQCLPNPDEKLTVLVNPQDMEFVSSFADSHWTLQADEAISVGGCKIKSGYSYVDYTLEHRFDNAVSHMIANLTEQASESVKKPLSDDFLMRPTEGEDALPDEESDTSGNDESAEPSGVQPPTQSELETESELNDEVTEEILSSDEVEAIEPVDENPILSAELEPQTDVDPNPESELKQPEQQHDPLADESEDESDTPR